MSWQAATAVQAHSQHGGTALLALLTIANNCDSYGGSAFVSTRDLAEWVRQTERNARYVLDKLLASGELVCYGRYEHGRQNTYIYGIALPGLAPREELARSLAQRHDCTVLSETEARALGKAADDGGKDFRAENDSQLDPADAERAFRVEGSDANENDSPHGNPIPPDDARFPKHSLYVSTSSTSKEYDPPTPLHRPGPATATPSRQRTPRTAGRPVATRTAPLRQVASSRAERPAAVRPEETPAPPASDAPAAATAASAPRHRVAATPAPRWGAADQARFDEWWARYPLKIGKKDCLAWWKRHRPGAELFATMLRALDEKLAVDPEFANGERLACPNPQTYLNGERWDDEIRPRGGKRSTGGDLVASRDSYIAAHGPQSPRAVAAPAADFVIADPAPASPPPTGLDYRALYEEFGFAPADQAKYRAMIADAGLGHELRSTIFYPPQGGEPGVILFLSGEQAQAVTGLGGKATRARVRDAVMKHYKPHNPFLKLWSVHELRELLKAQEA